MLSEVAITPEVFTQDAYSCAPVADWCIPNLKDRLLDDALVRNLHNGDWYKSINQNLGKFTPKGKELLTKLEKQKRLRCFPAINTNIPDSNIAWCAEALASHKQENLDCILVGPATKAECPELPLVVAVEKIRSHTWWKKSQMHVLTRNMSDYKTYLRLVLNQANSIMFIDPHLDPTKRQYSEFHHLLQLCDTQQVTKEIEIHRCCYEGPPKERYFPSKDEFEYHFSMLAPKIKGCKLKLDIFIWDDLHERFLITDVLGIFLGDGFDVNDKPVTWQRLDRQGRDNKQREFDPSATKKHKLQYKFQLSL